jgi:hypothetical protein
MKIPKQTIAVITCAFLATTTNAQDIKPYKAEQVKPYKAQEIKPVKSQEVKPYQAQEVKSNTTKTEATSTDNSKPDLSYFYGIYQYWVPGTSYTVLDYTNNLEVLHNSAGTGVLPGSLKIESNGTYTWNSSWDGKIIKGSWRLTGDTGYPIELLKAQEGKNWKVGKSNDKGVNIIIWDGSTWYNGRNVKSK